MVAHNLLCCRLPISTRSLQTITKRYYLVLYGYVSHMRQDSTVSELDTAEKLHSRVMRSENQTLEKLVSSKSGGSPLSSSQKQTQTQITSGNIEISSTTNPTSNNMSSETLKSSSSEVATIPPLTETTVQKSKIVSTDGGFKDNTVESAEPMSNTTESTQKKNATEKISEEHANDSSESTPTCPSNCEWDSGYEFPDDREEESVIDWTVRDFYI
jgi:hypothetical protein